MGVAEPQELQAQSARVQLSITGQLACGKPLPASPTTAPLSCQRPPGLQLAVLLGQLGRPALHLPKLCHVLPAALQLQQQRLRSKS